MPRAAARDAIYYRRRYTPEVIEFCVRWYLTYRLSYRDLSAMMAERDISVSHTTTCAGCSIMCRSSSAAGTVISASEGTIRAGVIPARPLRGHCGVVDVHACGTGDSIAMQHARPIERILGKTHLGQEKGFSN
jgi:hypothetical protein